MKFDVQIYVKESDKAVPFYQKAFDAELVASYPNPDGTFQHAGLDIDGVSLAISESWFAEVIKGNTMQFCLHFGEGKENVLQKAYEILQEGADILYPLGPCGWSSLMFGLIDKFGVSWCLAI